MPLIDQQDVVTVTSTKGARAAVAELKRILEAYPPVRLVSIAMSSTAGTVTLVAVVETT